MVTDALHFPIWVRDYQRTPVDGVIRAARLAFPGRKLEFPRLDEEHHLDSIAALRALSRDGVLPILLRLSSILASTLWFN
ncbi:MAG: hypothetical protein QOF24_1059 [Verrucomicrobiota bacterium]|jgi:hypothetical protein